jgi:hypothetical protein
MGYSGHPLAADPPTPAANGSPLRRIPRRVAGRAPGGRCARRVNAAGAGKRPAPTALGDEDPRPQALARGSSHASWRTSIGAGRPGRWPWLLRPRSGPSFGISCARAYRRLCPLRCGHRCCSSTRSAASRRDGAKRSVITVAMQQLVLRPSGKKPMLNRRIAKLINSRDLRTSDNARIHHRCNSVALIRLNQDQRCSSATYRSSKMRTQVVAVGA